ncbi:cysteine desulfurase family protein [Kocuria massiliensis]|uniref:cysteine desulfurase family protein n=1 Tax=Kocuria massiliensis TaxID=1926282 RepID=UPI000A1CC22E|nr:cysteine desulfurase family protein [Kocuria massiliensis]
MKGIYLDHAATAPVLDVALEAMVQQMRDGGNPSSLHASGRRARMAVETARENIARAVGADPAEVIFTAGGTEADNLAVKGMYWKRREGAPHRRRIILSPIEHHAVKDAALWLEARQDAILEWLTVDEDGRVNPKELAALLTDSSDVALVTVMMANNEVGTIQPISELAEICRHHEVPFHTDAVQAFGAIDVDFHALGCTSMAISGHKIGAPMGIGALIATRQAPLTAVIHGGGQERDVRSGTIDAPAIVGFGVAADHVCRHIPREAQRIAGLRDQLVAGVREAVPEAVLRGPHDLSPIRRLPGNAHFTFPGCEGDSLLFLLDMAGVLSSTGSACNAGVPRPSEVLLAMGLSEMEARGAQRFTLGHDTTAEDVERLVETLPGAYRQAAAAGMADHAPTGSWA